MKWIKDHWFDCVAAICGLALIVLCVMHCSGCSSVATIQAPRSETTTKAPTDTKTTGSVDAVLSASVAVGTADGQVVTLQSGTPVKLPPGAGVTLPAGTVIEHGWGALGAFLLWYIAIAACVAVPALVAWVVWKRVRSTSTEGGANGSD